MVSASESDATFSLVDKGRIYLRLKQFDWSSSIDWYVDVGFNENDRQSSHRIESFCPSEIQSILIKMVLCEWVSCRQPYLSRRKQICCPGLSRFSLKSYRVQDHSKSLLLQKEEKLPAVQAIAPKAMVVRELCEYCCERTSCSSSKGFRTMYVGTYEEHVAARPAAAAAAAGPLLRRDA